MSEPKVSPSLIRDMAALNEDFEQITKMREVPFGEPTPVDRMREVLLAEREVIEAAIVWDKAATSPMSWYEFEETETALICAVAKLREVRGK